VAPLLQSQCWVFGDSGLLDRTHLRWFTPITMASLFQDNGFRIDSCQPRIFPHQAESLVLEHIRAFATRLAATLNKPCVMPDPCKLSFVQNGNEPILTSNCWVTSQLHGPGTIARRLSNQLSTASPLRSAPPKPELQRLPGRGMRVLIPKVSMA